MSCTPLTSKMYRIQTVRSNPNSPIRFSMLFHITLHLRWVCAQFMANLRSAMLEILALLSTRQAGPLSTLLSFLPIFVTQQSLCSLLFCRFLAKQYGLTKDTIANGLPLIDTTATLVAQYCPPFLMTPQCEIQRCRGNLCSQLIFFPGTAPPRVHATTWRTQTGRWQ